MAFAGLRHQEFVAAGGARAERLRRDLETLAEAETAQDLDATSRVT